MRSHDGVGELDDVVERNSGFKHDVEVVAVVGRLDPNLADDSIIDFAQGQRSSDSDPSHPGCGAEVEDQVLRPAWTVSQCRRPS